MATEWNTRIWTYQEYCLSNKLYYVWAGYRHKLILKGECNSIGFIDKYASCEHLQANSLDIHEARIMTSGRTSTRKEDYIIGVLALVNNATLLSDGRVEVEHVERVRQGFFNVSGDYQGNETMCWLPRGRMYDFDNNPLYYDVVDNHIKYAVTRRAYTLNIDCHIWFNKGPSGLERSYLIAGDIILTNGSCDSFEHIIVIRNTTHTHKYHLLNQGWAYLAHSKTKEIEIADIIYIGAEYTRNFEDFKNDYKISKSRLDRNRLNSLILDELSNSRIFIDEEGEGVINVDQVKMFFASFGGNYNRRILEMSAKYMTVT